MLTPGEPAGTLRSEAEVESALGQATPPVARSIERCLQGRDPSEPQVVQLFRTRNADYQGTAQGCRLPAMADSWGTL